MSTKIYNGFIINADLATTLQHLRDKSNVFTRSIRFFDAIREAQFGKLVNLCFEAKVDCLETGKDIDEIYDTAFDSILPLMSEMRGAPPKRLTKHEFRKDPLRWSRELVKELAIRNEHEIVALRYDDDTGFNLNVVVFPHGEKTIGMIFNGEAKMLSKDGETSDVRTEFMKFAKLEDFSYWDNTDKPDEITEEEWSARAKAWDEAIPSWIPSKDGYSYHVFSASRDVFPMLTMNVVESLYSTRREHLVKIYAGYLFERLELAKKRVRIDDITMSETSRMLREIHEKQEINAPEYLDAVQKMNAAVPATFALFLADLGAIQNDTTAAKK